MSNNFTILPLPAELRPQAQPHTACYWKVSKNAKVRGLGGLWHTGKMKRKALDQLAKKEKTKKANTPPQAPTSKKEEESDDDSE